MSIIDQLRQPEYTGENRCTPCTIANVAIAAVASALIALASRTLGAAAFVVSLATISLRGYLVPGTPTLTKRYLPDRLLRRFEKEPASVPTTESATATIDSERVLLDADAVTPCEDGTDLRLTTEFRSEWRDGVRVERDHNDPGEETLRKVLDAGSEQVSFEAYGDALLAHIDDDALGQWPSTAAILADVAAANALAERYLDWTTTTPAERARVLASLRIFIETCPQCEGPVRVEQEAVESCCRSYDVLRSACEECDAALFEIEWSEVEQESPASSSDQSGQSTPVEV